MRLIRTQYLAFEKIMLVLYTQILYRIDLSKIQISHGTTLIELL